MTGSWPDDEPSTGELPINKCIVCHAVEVVDLQHRDGDARVHAAFIEGLTRGYGMHGIADRDAMIARIYDLACAAHKPDIAAVFGQPGRRRLHQLGDPDSMRGMIIGTCRVCGLIGVSKDDECLGPDPEGLSSG